MIMENKKGFTLTELLASLVVLGIILLIAIPSYTGYVRKSRINLYHSYERTLEDAARTYLTECLTNNICEDANLTYSSILGTRQLNIEKLAINTEKCDDASGYVAIIEDESVDSTDTEIDKYKYVTCLKCGSEYKSDSCSLVKNEGLGNDDLIIEQEKIEFVNSNDFDERRNCPNIYTNTSTYTYKVKYDDVKVSIDGELKTGICNNGACTFNESDYGKNIKLIDFSGDIACLNVVKDDEKPTVSKKISMYSTNVNSDISVSNEDFAHVWATSKKQTLTFKDNFEGLWYYNGSCSAENLSSLLSPINNDTSITLESDTDTIKTICIFDKAGNWHEENVEFTNITNVVPKVQLIGAIPDDYRRTYDAGLNLSSGISGMNITDSNLEWFVSSEASPTTVNNSTKGSKALSNTASITIGNSLSGEYYLFVKQITNEIGNKSSSSDIIEINGIKYHRFGKFKFYNNNLDNFFSINVNYPIAKDANGKVPYAELQVVPTENISSYPQELKSKGFSYSWGSGSNKMSISEPIQYSVTITDSIGNNTTKSIDCSNIIDSDFYSFVFNYNGYTPGTWTRNNVSINIAPKLKGRMALNYYRRNAFAGNALREINNPSIDFSETITASISDNSGLNSSLSVSGRVKVGDRTIEMSGTSGVIRIDKNKPSVTNITISEFNGNKSDSKREVIHSGNTYTIKYHDPNDNFFSTKNTDPVELKLKITLTDSHSGINTNGKYIRYNRTNEYITKETFNSRVQQIVNNMDNGEDKIHTIYIQVVDNVGNLSDEITIRFFRKTNNITGW